MECCSFPTPLLTSLGPSLLHKISCSGGHPFTSLIRSSGGYPTRASLEAAMDIAWEQLHSGPWHSVGLVWRDAYSMACLLYAKLCWDNRQVCECLRVLDLGIIMGGDQLKPDLLAAVTFVNDKITHSGTSNDETTTRNRCGGFNKVEVLKTLPPKSLSCKNIRKHSAPSLEGFLVDYLMTGCPVIISDCMAHWPARKKWNDMNYLKRVAGCRTVPVEVGKNYLCSDWKQELITFSQFLERIQSNECGSLGPTYLAQHQLFDQIQELREDILVPDYCFAGGGELRSLNAWFGPAGTVTPLHHDPHHNILAQDVLHQSGRHDDHHFIMFHSCGFCNCHRLPQIFRVVGKKYVRLYRESMSNELYPHKESMLCNSSQVDLDDIDIEKFPKVQDLEFLDCVLEEGEMLYIPPKWWHYVRSLTISFSVSFWWSDEETGSSHGS